MLVRVRQIEQHPELRILLRSLVLPTILSVCVKPPRKLDTDVAAAGLDGASNSAELTGSSQFPPLRIYKRGNPVCWLTNIPRNASFCSCRRCQ